MVLRHTQKLLRLQRITPLQFAKNVFYVQGQEPENKIREYFYYIDHQGMRITPLQFAKNVFYVQGQEPENKIREYFHYIDHQGMLFLDDARMKNFTSCFKEKKFLRFFFNQLRINTTGRYQEFPYVSLCGKERNFIRCDDYPFVFTHVVKKVEQNGEKTNLAYGHAGELLMLNFQPDTIFMRPDTGRVYHPAPDRAGSVGLIRSKLAIEFSKYFIFDEGESNPPTRFVFQDKIHELDKRWYYDAIKSRQS